MIWPLSRHVAERLIGEGRDPTSEETQHLEACPECATAFRRRSAFDAQLGTASRDLVSVQLDAQTLHAPNAAARPAGRLSLALVPIVIALVAIVALFGPPRDDASVAASPTPDPTSSHLKVRSLRIDCGSLTQPECAELTRPGRLPTSVWLIRGPGLPGQDGASSDRWPVAVTFLSRTEVRIDWSDGTTTRETVEPLRTIIVTPGPDN